MHIAAFGGAGVGFGINPGVQAGQGDGGVDELAAAPDFHAGHLFGFGSGHRIYGRIKPVRGPEQSIPQEPAASPAQMRPHDGEEMWHLPGWGESARLLGWKWIYFLPA